MIQRDLKDYIVKLNDRNIQRRRETGFTLYAILGSIAFCVFYLIDNIHIPTAIYDDHRYLNVAAFTSNALFIFSLFYISYGTATRRQTLTKIFPYKQPLSIEINDCPLFISFSTISVLNVWLLSRHQNVSHKIFLLVFTFLTALNILTPFVMRLYGIYNRHKKKRKGQSLEEFDFTFFNKRTIRLFSTAFLVYATILSVYWLTAASSINFALESKTVAAISKYLLIYFALLYLTKKTMDIKSKEYDNNELEDFEKEIFFENISNEEIVKKYEKDFDGIPFSKWITEKQIEIMNFFEQKQQAFLTQELLICSIDSIDKKQLPYVFSGKLQVIIDNQFNNLNEAADFVQRISGAFNNLKKFSSLNEDEVSRLNYVQKYLNQLIMSFNRQYSNLSIQISIRQNK